MSRLPRHTFNLATGIYLGWFVTNAWWCDELMVGLARLSWLATIIFHGAHCVGYARWADAVFMKYDFGLVVLITIRLLSTTPRDGLSFCVPAIACSFGIWLLTFGPLRGLPYNPVQCLMHLSGCVIHGHAASYVCSRG